jgi:hypothetical protein
MLRLRVAFASSEAMKIRLEAMKQMPSSAKLSGLV